ncbi:MAG: CerR family C-terminal domain-containing protein [Sphingomonas sp.]|jgi:AcrR family transcriptional regulator|uniref:CerR family C-terminal domain-containing protein n=1 Tax=Sphingomonas sp. TaxID=28214 RepID=UPI00356A828B
MVQQRLLDIAAREFSLKGLDGASTREIAAAAGTVMSSITYHYGGKEGLYLAVADHVAEHMGRDMIGDPVLDDVGDPNPDDARRMIHHIVDRFIDKMVGAHSTVWSLFIVREQINPTAAFERIWSGMMGRMMEWIVALVCIATGRSDAKVARIATITLLGQVIVLRASRASCLKLLQSADFDAADIRAIKARIAINIDATLDTLTAEQEPK